MAEPNGMQGIAQEPSLGFHVLQYAPSPLDPRVSLKSDLFCDIFDKALRNVYVQVVEYENMLLPGFLTGHPRNDLDKVPPSLWGSGKER